MNIQEKAKHFLRFWHRDNEGGWKLSDNAPTPLILYVRSLPKTTDMGTVHLVLESLSTRGPLPNLDKAALLQWVARDPAAADYCDQVLKNPTKNKSSTLESLLGKAWQTYAYSLSDSLHKYFV